MQHKPLVIIQLRQDLSKQFQQKLNSLIFMKEDLACFRTVAVECVSFS